MAAAVFA